MAAFSSYQLPAFVADSLVLPNVSAIRMDGALDDFIPNLNQFYSPLSRNCQKQQPVTHNQEGTFDASDCAEQQSPCNDPCHVTQKQPTESLSMADKAESGEQVTQNWVPAVKKRKSKKGSSSNSANSKDAKQVKCKKQKADNAATNDVDNDNKDQNIATEEPPKGYIHVRARRGQATDSHSLAERVRREKISEKMKMLQGLVPGCDKVTGKALMLDEIINYVQSLQNQVEFLSMKLASLDPLVYNFGLMDLNAAMVSASEGANTCMPLPMPLMQPSSSGCGSGSGSNSQPQSFANAMTQTSPSTSSTSSATFPSSLVDKSANLFLNEHNPSFLALQDAGSSYWGMDEQVRQTIINQFGFSANNLCTFQ